MFLLCFPCFFLKVLCNVVFHNTLVSLSVCSYVFFSSLAIDLFFKNCLYSRFVSCKLVLMKGYVVYFYQLFSKCIIHHIHYSPVVVGYVAALIMYVFRYLEDGQMIAYIIYYQPTLYIR